MNKKIAILDVGNQDIGLKILFPDADYYIFNNDTHDKTNNIIKYNININYNLDNINNYNYDYLFIIISLFDFRNDFNFLNKLNSIINRNFKKVILFDNYDYDYDPNDYIPNKNITYFFKRNYNKTKKYKNNVIPFSFIMFGQYSIIELLDYKRKLSPNYIKQLYFSGTLFHHFDKNYNNYSRNRQVIYEKIRHIIYNSGNIPFNNYLDIINTSKFCLDLNGVGDPNKRTFEIFTQGSLRISEYNNLKWCFDEDFCEETIFKDENDFFIKYNRLCNDDELYKKCLDRQNYIIDKYYNKDWIKSYILKYLE